MANSAFLNTIMDDPANRHPQDFYPTPKRGTDALLAVERFKGGVWEPACGNGSMSEVLVANKYKVYSSDLYDRGYGDVGIDFLAQSKRRGANIITNPPFKLAEEFALHALTLTTGKVALLCRLAWLEGQKRKIMFTSTPLARVWVFSKRIPMLRNSDVWHAGGGGMLAFAWYVWEHGYTGKPTLGWLE